jgi:CRISPR-associated protein Cas1
MLSVLHLVREFAECPNPPDDGANELLQRGRGGDTAESIPLIAESTVLTAINNRFVSTRHFVSAGRAVNLSADGRKQFFQCFEQRMNAPITHPIFDYKVTYRRALELQFRILARVLTGEIPEYAPFLTR